eukprot:gb/GFBE01043602.1/.p1 GENE.gb/GFBE01043602.1/~~gb/GFBE01043602.1/.p1  ORF type:complete len:323 (+),score=48.59 gb/GFBE01043602.1/:1-969(+)
MTRTRSFFSLDRGLFLVLGIGGAAGLLQVGSVEDRNAPEAGAAKSELKSSGLLSRLFFSSAESENVPRQRDLEECPAPRSLPPAFPERCCVMCPASPQLWPLPDQDSYRKTKVTFRNVMTEDAEMRWVDSKGVEHDKGVLPAGHRAVFMTQEGHVTRAYSRRDGRLLVEHMAGRRVLGNDSQVDMGMLARDLLGPAAAVDLEQMNAAAKGSNFRKEPIPPKNDTDKLRDSAFPHYGFTNTLSVDVQLFWRGNGQEKQIYELKPGETHFELTYPGHVWVARTRNGQLLTELRVGDVRIADCAAQGAGQDTEAASSPRDEEVEV